MSHLYQQASFLTSAATLDQAPADYGSEVAFAGRSNVGKSSVLNTLCHNKKLARTSKTPGRTQLLNFFALDETHRLVDLPGYGYAKVPPAVKKRWQETLNGYFEERESLRGLILIMDCRHPLMPLDQQMLEWTAAAGLPTHLLLNKADKLKSGARQQVLQEVARHLSNSDIASVQLFSATTGIGIKELQQQLVKWL